MTNFNDFNKFITNHTNCNEYSTLELMNKVYENSGYPGLISLMDGPQNINFEPISLWEVIEHNPDMVHINFGTSGDISFEKQDINPQNDKTYDATISDNDLVLYNNKDYTILAFTIDIMEKSESSNKYQRYIDSDAGWTTFFGLIESNLNGLILTTTYPDNVIEYKVPCINGIYLPTFNDSETIYWYNNNYKKSRTSSRKIFYYHGDDINPDYFIKFYFIIDFKKNKIFGFNSENKKLFELEPNENQKLKDSRFAIIHSPVRYKDQVITWSKAIYDIIRLIPKNEWDEEFINKLKEYIINN